jgi:hypothetical protein
MDKHISEPQRIQYCAEHSRIESRRRSLGLDKDQEALPPKKWAIALSGGGIRSATFALGVLQAMAKAPAPPGKGHFEDDDIGSNLLPHIDYLSTVSGGGYLGAFFCSLFLPNRLRPSTKNGGNGAVCESSKIEAAKNAYAVFKFEPPGRIHTSKNYRTANVGEGPLAWLRENGRYLTPSGSGDLFYAIALSIRNLLSLHYVVGMPLLFLVTLFSLIKFALQSSLLCTPKETFPASAFVDYPCDSLWWIPVAWCVLIVVPLMLSFWLIYSRETEEEPAPLFNLASWLVMLTGLSFAVVAYYIPSQYKPVLILLWLSAVVIAMGVLLYATIIIVGRLRSKKQGFMSVRNFRVQVTRRLAQAFIMALALCFLALIPSLSAWAYELLKCYPLKVTPALLLPALIAAIRGVTQLLDEKAMPKWLDQLPINVIAGMIGATMFLLIAMLWGVLVEWVRWNDSAPNTIDVIDDYAAWRLAGLAAVTLVLTWLAGQFIGFINLSSLHAFYSSRLARAYLGASNGQRFESSDNPEKRNRRMSVAETSVGDDISLETYYGTQTCGPLHLINVTMNQTVDPGEQLVQRDRKGKPLCIAPNYYPQQHDMDLVSFILDGEPRIRSTQHKWFSEINQPLSVGHWIATSGAAITTGLGRATTLGTSIALGLANVRLGTWWPCNFLEENEQKPDRRVWRDKGFARFFPTQTYLFYEMTAQFYGYRRDYQYLSDGGHFENTAAYELIRTGRDIELIVLCDAGCDVNYGFEDLANLVRLARIDQALEIREDTAILGTPILSSVFGSAKDFTTLPDASSQHCARLFNVYECDGEPLPVCKILVIKPRLIAGLPVDVNNYAKTHPAFPNETTADQFFDEAQFESYRQLGLQIGQLLFGDQNTPSDTAQALWNYLQ